MPSRHQQVVVQAARTARTVVADVLAERVAEHYSQADWEGFATEIAENLARRLAEDETLRDVTEAGELKKSDGTINLVGVYQVMCELRDDLEGTPKHAQIAYLVQHMYKTLTSLRLMSEVKPMKEGKSWK